MQHNAKKPPFCCCRCSLDGGAAAACQQRRWRQRRRQRPPPPPPQVLALALLVLAAAAQWRGAEAAVKFDPCAELTPLRRGGEFTVGLALWPGGTLEDWGPADGSGLNPCNASVQANLTALGVMFGAYNARVDRLTVLKTSFPEELLLTARAPAAAPRVVSLVAFRAGVRSDARYAASFEPGLTGGTGFVATLALLAKFDAGALRYLQFYNLTCNDCGGRLSTRCLNATSCALAPSECMCPDAAAGDNTTAAANTTTTTTTATAPSSSSCSYANFSFCAAGVNLAFEGTDAAAAALATAAQVRKLSSFSLLSLFYTAKSTFFNVKDLFVDRTGDAWGRFGAARQDIADAYSGNAAAYTDAASSGGSMFGR